MTKIFWRKDAKQRGPDTVYPCAPSVTMFFLLYKFPLLPRGQLELDCFPSPGKPRPQGEEARAGSAKTINFQTGPWEAPRVHEHMLSAVPCKTGGERSSRLRSDCPSPLEAMG